MARSVLTALAASMALAPSGVLNRSKAALGEPKPCTWASLTPLRPNSARNWARGAGPAVAVSITVPPAKSVPKFRPVVARLPAEASTSTPETIAAMGARRVNLKCVWAGTNLISGHPPRPCGSMIGRALGLARLNHSPSST